VSPLGVAVGAALVFALIAALALKAWLDARRSLHDLREGMPGELDKARKDAIVRSRAVTRGQTVEQLAPFTESFGYDPRDARFLGSPIDLVVFDGLSEGYEVEVVFVEVKTGASRLNEREQAVRDAVEDRRVSWRELRL